MCGIVGYIGSNEAKKILIQSLGILEYRGYDSAGIATLHQNKITTCKSEGKLSSLIQKLKITPIQGSIGIGHTRWATHGKPNDINAHPHTSHNHKITLVHNGIVNNYLELKNQLITEHNIEFQSETDTEVIVNQLSVYQSSGLSLYESVKKLSRALKGNYALCILSADNPDEIILTSHSAPLIIGIGDNELFCASDSAALMPYTDQIIRLENNQIAKLKVNGQLEIFNSITDEQISPSIQTISTSSDSLNKGEFKHYLLKEIHEQPTILRKLYQYHFDAQNNIHFPDLDTSIFKSIKKILIIGCGTAYYAGLIGKCVIESLAEVPVDIEFASELSSKSKLLIDSETLVIAISQSGETADTLMAVEKARKHNAPILAINNRPESTLANIAENSCIFTQAGIEVSVAATKSLMAQIFCLYLVALYLAEQKETTSLDNLAWLKQQLQYQPTAIEQAIARKLDYKQAILPYADQHAFIFLGRGIHYAAALEGALKLKELTYVQATGYASGEMKHGPIATLDSTVSTVSLLLNSPNYHKTLHNTLEAKTRGSHAIGIVSDGDTIATEELDSILYVPIHYNLPAQELHIQELINPFVALIPLQLMSYYLAEYLGKDVDQPRNLAKSVTVE